MCFYDSFTWSCNDWKWGNFRQHCQREYRTGETCGSRFVYQTLEMSEKCKMCLKIEAKQRRRAKHIEDYNRWRKEPRRYQASMEKALGEIKSLDNEISQLTVEKDDKYRNIGSRGR